MTTLDQRNRDITAAKEREAQQPADHRANRLLSVAQSFPLSIKEYYEAEIAAGNFQDDHGKPISLSALLYRLSNPEPHEFESDSEEEKTNNKVINEEAYYFWAGYQSAAANFALWLEGAVNSTLDSDRHEQAETNRTVRAALEKRRRREAEEKADESLV